VKDYYKILRVDVDAEPEVIRAAYRQLCKLYHPDVCSSPLAKVKLQDINEAYSVLSAPNRRSEYDREYRCHSQATSDSRGFTEPPSPPKSTAHAAPRGGHNAINATWGKAKTLFKKAQNRIVEKYDKYKYGGIRIEGELRAPILGTIIDRYRGQHPGHEFSVAIIYTSVELYTNSIERREELSALACIWQSGPYGIYLDEPPGDNISSLCKEMLAKYCVEDYSVDSDGCHGFFVDCDVSEIADVLILIATKIYGIAASSSVKYIIKDYSA